MNVPSSTHFTAPPNGNGSLPVISFSAGSPAAAIFSLF